MSQEATLDKVAGFLNLVHAIPVWIDGGWGIDALIGKQTRSHSDLDIIIDQVNFTDLEKLLLSNNFAADTAQDGLVFVSVDGLCLDVHCVKFYDSGYGSFQITKDTEWPFPPSAFKGKGLISDITVMCLSPEAQVQCHGQGYPPTEKDIADMRLLQEVFEVVLPLTLCVVNDTKQA